MVNTEEFITRLREIITQNELSSSAFAEKLGVQRATISHLLSGRNKPSLDFVMKVLTAFPDVDLYWLLNGKGAYQKEDIIERIPDKISPSTSTPSDQDLFSQEMNVTENTSEEKNQIDEMQQKINPAVIHSIKKNISGKETEISKILILYKDGSFEVFQN
ncbi:MAG: helix-turn-helix transcriptional regulator [Flavobacteriaceae bacterium]|nr:helix-turn-helix transcriptional regulator [Flavobacteriaceae bacterium]